MNQFKTVSHKYYITNPLVRERKGDSFWAKGNDYYVKFKYRQGQQPYAYEDVHEDMYRNSLTFFWSVEYNPSANDLFFILSIDKKAIWMPYLLKNKYSMFKLMKSLTYIKAGLLSC